MNAYTAFLADLLFSSTTLHGHVIVSSRKSVPYFIRHFGAFLRELVQFYRDRRRKTTTVTERDDITGCSENRGYA